MKPVTKDQFYAKVGPLNVIASIQGSFPYTAIWKLQTGFQQVVGKSVDRVEGGRVVTDYYLA